MWQKSAIFSSISLQEVQVLFPGTGLKLQNSQKTAILPKIHDWEAAALVPRVPGFGTDGTAVLKKFFKGLTFTNQNVIMLIVH